MRWHRALTPRAFRAPSTQVAAKKFEVPANWVAPVFPKAPEDEEFLKSTMMSNKLMKNLSPSDREQLMHAFEKKEFETGVAIITQVSRRFLRPA